MTPGDGSRAPAKVTLIALALGLAFALNVSGAQAKPTGARTACGELTGIHWSTKTAGGSLGGTRYRVAANGFSCSLAVKLVPALIKQKGTPFGRTLKGPAGYTCIADVGGNNPHAIAGLCHRSGGKSFAWGPKIG
jgi:hypothetical protein